MKTAHIETIGGVIRVFPEGNKYGDPYEYSAAFRTLTHNKVEVIGILKTPSPSQWRAMKKCFRENGFKIFVVTRKRKDGSTEVREHPT